MKRSLSYSKPFWDQRGGEERVSWGRFSEENSLLRYLSICCSLFLMDLYQDDIFKRRQFGKKEKNKFVNNLFL